MGHAGPLRCARVIDGRGLTHTRADALATAWGKAIEHGFVELPVLVCDDDIEKTLCLQSLDDAGNFCPEVYRWLRGATCRQVYHMFAVKAASSQIQRIYATLAEDFSLRWAKTQRDNAT